jgi:hypothetical protein
MPATRRNSAFAGSTTSSHDPAPAYGGVVPDELLPLPVELVVLVELLELVELVELAPKVEPNVLVAVPSPLALAEPTPAFNAAACRSFSRRGSYRNSHVS